MPLREVGSASLRGLRSQRSGRFEGATGTLYFYGVGNEDGTGFESAVRGEVCLRVHPRDMDKDRDD